MRLDNKGRLPSANDPRYIFKEPKNMVRYNINPETGFLTSGEGGIEEVFIEGNIPPASADSVSYNFHPTSWGMSDPKELH